MSDPGAEPRLVVPEGLVIDESARERLERAARRRSRRRSRRRGRERRARARRELPRARRVDRARDTAGRAGAEPAGGRSIRGAVLVRPDVEFAVRDGRVEVADGAVVVDPGAHVHDPSAATGALQPASERGRPPFPRRPVVVFLACEPPSVADADWVRRLVNRLVRHDVEARIAFPSRLDAAGDRRGRALTRPCLADGGDDPGARPRRGRDARRHRRRRRSTRGARATARPWWSRRPDARRSRWSSSRGRSATRPGRLRARIGPLGRRARVRRARRAGSARARIRCRPPKCPSCSHVRTPVREHWTADASADAVVGCVVLTGAGADAAGARRGARRQPRRRRCVGAHRRVAGAGARRGAHGAARAPRRGRRRCRDARTDRGRARCRAAHRARPRARRRRARRSGPPHCRSGASWPRACGLVVTRPAARATPPRAHRARACSPSRRC